MGLGFVLWNSHGDILIAGVIQGASFVNQEVGEARSCLVNLQCVTEAEYDGLVVEGDSLHLIQKLRSKSIRTTLLAYLFRTS